MKKWLRRIRGAIGMGLTWAIGWGLAGLLIGVASILLPGLPWDRFFEVFDAPLPALAVPGFFGGVFFSMVLGIAGRRRRFRELSLPVFAAWGALGGLLLSLFPAVLVGVGLASTEGADRSLWQGIAVIIAPFILLGAVSAAVTLMLARAGERRELSADAEAAGTALTNGAARELAEDELIATRESIARPGERARRDRA
jgi:ABC-type dipeptide/oligopeptide/nickel transport system permease component